MALCQISSVLRLTRFREKPYCIIRRRNSSNIWTWIKRDSSSGANRICSNIPNISFYYRKPSSYSTIGNKNSWIDNSTNRDHSSTSNNTKRGHSSNNMIRQLYREEERAAVLADPAAKDILRRTRVVTCAAEARTIIQNLLAAGDPVGVDMEGVTTGPEVPTSLIQVADKDKNIYLFRTGINVDIYHKGRLKDLLEAPHITKIMHASSVDCMSVYKDGVQMWGLFDTAVAHKVLDFQVSGRSINSSPTIGLNDLCTLCGLTVNPLKHMFKDFLWKQIVYGSILEKNGDLPEEMILYCAYDVELLHDIYSNLRFLIDTDYQHLVSMFSEIELIRSIDPALAKEKRARWKTVELSTVFLQSLSPVTTKPEAYRLVENYPGHKQVYFSHVNGSCNIVLDSRQDALAFYKATADTMPTVLGEEASVSIVVPTHPTEVGEDIRPEDKTAERNDSWVTDPTVSVELLASLVTASVPVVVDFHQYPQILTVELYTGTSPAVNIALTSELVTHGGLGAFFASDEVTKILFRTDTKSVFSVLKVLKEHNYEMTNWFDLTAGYKFLDYVETGQSIFKSQAMSIQKMCSNLALAVDNSGKISKLDWYYDAYLLMDGLLSGPVKGLLRQKQSMDAKIGANIDLTEEKAKRKEFRTRREAQCVHFKFKPWTEETRKNDIVDKIEILLKEMKKEKRDLFMLEDSILVELKTADCAKAVLKHFQKLPDKPFTVSSPDTVKQVDSLAGRLALKPRHQTLGEVKEANLARLKAAGVLELLNRMSPARSTAGLKTLLEYL